MLTSANQWQQHGAEAAPPVLPARHGEPPRPRQGRGLPAHTHRQREARCFSFYKIIFCKLEKFCIALLLIYGRDSPNFWHLALKNLIRENNLISQF